MGACVSLDRLDASGGGVAAAAEVESARLQPLSSDALSLLAAQHWLTLEQLHHLFIARKLQQPGVCSTCSAFCHLSTCTELHSPAASAACLPPASEPQQQQQQMDLLLLDQSIPAPSPADRLGSAADISEGQAVYRSEAERERLFSSRVRPLLRDALLSNTELAEDAVSVVLDFLVQPPQLSDSQLVLLALLTSQHLTDAKLEEHERRRQRQQQQPPQQEPPAFSDLLLTHCGDWTHRSGVIDRRASLQAGALRLNFATLRTGTWSIAQVIERQPAAAAALAATTDAADAADAAHSASSPPLPCLLLLDTACTREYFFSQELFADRSRRRRLQLRILPYEQQAAERWRESSNACWNSRLLVVCGDGIAD